MNGKGAMSLFYPLVWLCYHRDDQLTELIEQELTDQYRLFGSLESHLLDPPHFFEQALCQLETHVQQSMVTLFYQFDDAVVREFLGKKLTSKLRKDLDDVATSTGTTLGR